MENVTFVTCQICGKTMKELNSHLPKVHGVTVEEYLSRFPTAKIICEESAQKKSERCSAARKELLASGYTVSEETRQKMAARARKHWEANRDDPKFMDKMRKTAANARAAKGEDYRHSDETREKMRGPREHMRGVKRSDETRQKLSEKAKLRKPGPHSDATIQKMKDAWVRRRQDTATFKEYLRDLSARTKIYAAERGYPAMDKSTPNGFERLYIRFCNDKGIDHVWNHEVEGRRYDFFLPESNTLVELDGEFWHRQPQAIQNDQLKNEIARRRGYRLIRISSDDANSPRSMLQWFRQTFDWTPEQCQKHNDRLIEARVGAPVADEAVDLPSDLFSWS